MRRMDPAVRIVCSRRYQEMAVAHPDCNGEPIAVDRYERGLCDMNRTGLTCLAVLLAISVGACASNEPEPGTVRDEAMRAGLAPEHFVRPTPDYFRDMDFNVVPGGQKPLGSEAVAGRNMWMVWTGGNDRLWDRLTVDSLGTFDLLKT